MTDYDYTDETPATFDADTVREMFARIGPGSDHARRQEENFREWERATRACIEIVDAWQSVSPRLDHLDTPALVALWAAGYRITAEVGKEMKRR